MVAQFLPTALIMIDLITSWILFQIPKFPYEFCCGECLILILNFLQEELSAFHHPRFSKRIKPNDKAFFVRIMNRKDIKYFKHSSWYEEKKLYPAPPERFSSCL